MAGRPLPADPDQNPKPAMIPGSRLSQYLYSKDTPVGLDVVISNAACAPSGATLRFIGNFEIIFWNLYSVSLNSEVVAKEGASVEFHNQNGI